MAARSGDGGYEYNFIGDVKDFECPLCLHVTREPNLTSCCGQHFCGSCIHRIVINRKRCPFCKERRFTVLLDKKQKRKVLELRVACTERSRNCTWTGQVGELDAHTDECGFVDVRCPKNCGTELQRRLLDDHLRRSCPNRSYECQYCGHKDTYRVIVREHIPECPKYPVSCPNNCTADTFKRQMLSNHIIQDCPLQQVDCEYKCFGCSAVVVRREVGKHMEENIQQHLLLTSKELKSTREKLVGAESKITLLTNRVADLEDRTFVVPLTFFVHDVNQFHRQTLNFVVVGRYTLLTHPNGYRLQLSCMAGGSGLLAFGIEQVVSENDQNLQWPLCGTIYLTLLNQVGDQNHITKSCDIHVEKSDGPTTIELLPELFTRLEEVTNYVHQDGLLFKVDIITH